MTTTASMSSKPFAVVTGGSSGIGFALAEQFVQHNFDLLIAAEPDGLEDAANQLRSFGGAVDSLAVDLATFEGVDGLYQKIKAAARPVDAAAINAGFGLGGAFIGDTDLATELKMINLNVVSTVHLAKHLLTDMVARGQGRVLFTASIASISPTPYETVYGATKAFILSFSESLHNELKGTGVTTTALMPGPTDTNFFHRADMDDTKVGAGQKDDPGDVAKQGYDALMAGKERIIAGSLKTKLLGYTTDLMPDSLNAEQHKKMATPGTAEK